MSFPKLQLGMYMYIHAQSPYCIVVGVRCGITVEISRVAAKTPL